MQDGQLEVFISAPGPITLVTTHPFQYFGDDGGPIAGTLAALGRAVIVNPRGTGGSSPAAAERTVQQLADDLDGVRRAMDLTKWVVVGQSLGGCVALQYALCYPESVAALLLSCTTARGLADERLSVYHPEHPDNAVVREELAAGRSSVVRKLVAHRSELVVDEPSGGWSPERQRSFAAELPELRLWDRLHEITVPTLVIGGRHDRAIPVQHSEELADRIPNGRLLIFETSGHFPYLEEPDAYVQVLSAFLAALED